MSGPPVRLQLQARATRLDFDDGRAVTLPIGAAGLGEAVLCNDPPTPLELERAIDRVEHALATVPDVAGGGGDLKTSDPVLRSLPGWHRSGSVHDRDEVEALFQRLASRALGTPVAADELPRGRDVAAALLILRECMHHLDFERVVAVSA